MFYFAYPTRFFKIQKRIRYRIPSYSKAEKINENIKKYDKNQKHIFRLKTLHNIYAEIACVLLRKQYTIPLDDIRLTRNGFILYFELDKVKKEYVSVVEAEMIGTENLSIKERLKIHIEALRDLRAGRKVKKYRPKKVKEVA